MSENQNFDPSARPRPHDPEKANDLLIVIDSKLAGVAPRSDGSTNKEFFGEFDTGEFSQRENDMFGAEIEGNPALFAVRRIPIESPFFDGTVAKVAVRPAFPGGYHIEGSRAREIAFKVKRTDTGVVISEELPFSEAEAMEQIAFQKPELIEDIEALFEEVARMRQSSERVEHEMGLSGVIDNNRADELIAALGAAQELPGYKG